MGSEVHLRRGELEGAKPASNQIKCRAKPCLARRAWSEATIFVPQGGTKITTLFQAVVKASGFYDSRKAVNKKILVGFDLSCVDRVVKRGYDFEAGKQPVSRKDDARVILCTRSRERHRRQGVSDGGAAFGGHGGAVPRIRGGLRRGDDQEGYASANLARKTTILSWAVPRPTSCLSR